MDTRTETFCERLKDRRKRNGLTQSELGKMVYSCATTVSEWEHGKALPRVDQINTLCDIFGVSADWLLGRRLKR